MKKNFQDKFFLLSSRLKWRDLFQQTLLREIPRLSAIWRIARNDSSRRGQALITLLFFVIIAVTITSAATVVIGVNSLALTKLAEGSIAYYAAEAGLENAILRAIRDPLYTGETLPIDDIDVTITVVPSGLGPKTVTVVNASGNFRRTIEAQMDYNSGYYTILGWKEI